MVAVAFFVGILLQTVEIHYLYKACLDIWLEYVGKQLTIADAVVVVDEYLIHAQTVVVLYPLHGIAVFQPSDGTHGHLAVLATFRLPQLAVLLQPLGLRFQVVVLP